VLCLDLGLGDDKRAFFRVCGLLVDLLVACGAGFLAVFNVRGLLDGPRAGGRKVHLD
jgi:hypothetical protein